MGADTAGLIPEGWSITLTEIVDDISGRSDIPEINDAPHGDWPTADDCSSQVDIEPSQVDSDVFSGRSGIPALYDSHKSTTHALAVQSFGCHKDVQSNAQHDDVRAIRYVIKADSPLLNRVHNSALLQLTAGKVSDAHLRTVKDTCRNLAKYVTTCLLDAEPKQMADAVVALYALPRKTSYEIVTALENYATTHGLTYTHPQIKDNH